MKAAVLVGPRQVEVREMADPAPGPGEVVVKVMACGICGTDLHAYRGELPLAAGLPPGHELAGEVVAVGEGVEGVAPGQRVAVEPLKVCRRCPYCERGELQLCPSRVLLGTFLPGGMAQLVAVPAYSIYPLPEGMDYSLAALAEPLAVAVHGLHLAGLGMGERVLVLGSGSIGLMVVLAAAAAGAHVVATYRHRQQGEAALWAGAQEVYKAEEDLGHLRARAQKEPFDVVVEAVGGRAETLQLALEMARPGGRVAVLGLFTAAVPLSALLLMLKEVRVVGAITYCRRHLRTDFAVALGLLARHGERARALVSHRFPLAEAAQAFATAQDKATGALKVQVLPWA